MNGCIGNHPEHQLQQLVDHHQLHDSTSVSGNVSKSYMSRAFHHVVDEKKNRLLQLPFENNNSNKEIPLLQVRQPLSSYDASHIISQQQPMAKRERRRRRRSTAMEAHNDSNKNDRDVVDEDNRSIDMELKLLPSFEEGIHQELILAEDNFKQRNYCSNDDYVSDSDEYDSEEESYYDDLSHYLIYSDHSCNTNESSTKADHSSSCLPSYIYYCSRNIDDQVDDRNSIATTVTNTVDEEDDETIVSTKLHQSLRRRAKNKNNSSLLTVNSKGCKIANDSNDLAKDDVDKGLEKEQVGSQLLDSLIVRTQSQKGYGAFSLTLASNILASQIYKDGTTNSLMLSYLRNQLNQRVPQLAPSSSTYQSSEFKPPTTKTYDDTSSSNRKHIWLLSSPILGSAAIGTNEGSSCSISPATVLLMSDNIHRSIQNDETVNGIEEIDEY